MYKNCNEKKWGRKTLSRLLGMDKEEKFIKPKVKECQYHRGRKLGYRSFLQFPHINYAIYKPQQIKL
jgi:hypothetical protein